MAEGYAYYCSGRVLFREGASAIPDIWRGGRWEPYADLMDFDTSAFRVSEDVAAEMAGGAENLTLPTTRGQAE